MVKIIMTKQVPIAIWVSIIWTSPVVGQSWIMLGKISVPRLEWTHYSFCDVTSEHFEQRYSEKFEVKVEFSAARFARIDPHEHLQLLSHAAWPFGHRVQVMWASQPTLIGIGAALIRNMRAPFCDSPFLKQVAAILHVQTDSLNPTTIEKWAEGMSKQGGSQAATLGGLICRNKDTKKGQQDKYSMWMR
ncbi:hypothetical protein BDQ17DRAFT_1333427 [Cyathus striatus]|nr:hypothetical protein BDQ17DRAFT_1333427 [Cyathus striatus]